MHIRQKITGLSSTFKVKGKPDFQIVQFIFIFLNEGTLQEYKYCT